MKHNGNVIFQRAKKMFLINGLLIRTIFTA